MKIFIETYRARMTDDYSLKITKDQMLRQIIKVGIASLDYELLNEDPIAFFAISKLDDGITS